MAELYRLTFPNGKCYVGVTTKTADKRFSTHCMNARRGGPSALHAAIRKYGSNNVVCETLAVAAWGDYLFEAEKKAIAVFNTKAPSGYNLTAGGEGASGYRHSKEMLKYLSEIRVGIPTRPHLEDTKRKMSTASKGVPKSEEHRKSLSTALRNRKLSPEHVENIRKVSTGRTHSEKTKILLAEKGRDISDATRAKRSLAAKAQHARSRAQKETGNAG